MHFKNHPSNSKILTQCYKTQIAYLIQLQELGTLPDDMTMDDVLKSNGSNIDNIAEEMISNEELS